LQQRLGDNYYVIEEGLGGRTTDLDHYNPDKPSRNGLAYFKACIDSHMPLDTVIIMLGSNDLKTMYDRTADDIAKALKLYIAYINKYCGDKNLPVPRVILVSPPYMNEDASRFTESMAQSGVYDAVSAQKSHELAGPIHQLADDEKCIFLDAGPITETGDDGLHLTQASHAELANRIAEFFTSPNSH